MENYFDNKSLFGVIKKYRWHLVIITVVAALAGIVFSGSTFITPKFKSYAVIYPYNLNTYSDENETEQMLQYINSPSILDSVTEKNGLLEHYRISKTYPYWKTALMREWNSNVKIARTPFDAVSITVLDKDPQMAYTIANDIVNFYNKKVNYVNKQRRVETLRMYGTQLKIKEAQIDSLKTRLAEISSEYGVVDYEAQSREVTKWYLNGSKSDKGTEMKSNLEQYGPEVIKLKAMIEEETAIYSKEKMNYDTEMTLYATDLTFYQMVAEPFAADRKSYPIRWVIVLLAAVGALLISTLTILVIERNKNRE